MLLASGLLAAESSGGGSPLASFVPLLLIVVVGYFLLVRPTRRRQQEMAAVRSRIQPGVEVQTTAGLLAKVADIEEDGVLVLEVAPGVLSRYLPGAVARVLTPEPEHEGIEDADLEPGNDDTGGHPRD